jgi:metal-responsive CopG/Arc/MetJ family transcriptional regulator
MNTRLQISLPENTLQLIDTFISNQTSDSPEETQKERIKFIDEAIQFYLIQKQQHNLK